MSSWLLGAARAMIDSIIHTLGTTLSVIILFGILALAGLGGVVIYSIHIIVSDWERHRKP